MGDGLWLCRLTMMKPKARPDRISPNVRIGHVHLKVADLGMFTHPLDLGALLSESA